MRLALVVLLASATAHADESPQVARWLATQNQRDFAAYQALYAPTFAGVKRVGRVAKPMNRAAWLADRKKMFATVFIVTAKDLRVTTDGDRVVVELEQTFAQGAFADVGHKRLIFDRGGFIVGEEMLDSRVLLTEAACVHTLFPREHLVPRLDVTVVDLGTDRFVCSVDTKGSDKVDVSLGVIVRTDTGWKVVERQDLSYPFEELNAEDFEEDGAVELSPVELGPETAVLVERMTRRDGPEYKSLVRTHKLYRVTPTGLASLLEFESSESGGEAVRDDVCALKVLTQSSRGRPDLEVACNARTGDFHGPEGEVWKDSEKVTRYRWNGNRYVSIRVRQSGPD